METITTVERLRELLGEPAPLTPSKIHDSLSDQARAYIARSPLFLLATASPTGTPTVSPKGDRPGFVHVENERTLHIPERPGNRLLFSLRNVLTNPQVGLIFLLPGTEETLRVGGRARLIRDDALNQRFAARGKPALLVMQVDITECYFHCAKAFLRSALWQADTWPDRLQVSFAKEIARQRGADAPGLADLDSQIAKRYQTDL